MAQRPAKTSAELKALIKDGLQNCPDCSNVEPIIQKMGGGLWNVAVSDDGPSIRCLQAMQEIANRLRIKYDLAEGD
jgi:hypothetical protein